MFTAGGMMVRKRRGALLPGSFFLSSEQFSDNRPKLHKLCVSRRLAKISVKTQRLYCRSVAFRVRGSHHQYQGVLASAVATHVSKHLGSVLPGKVQVEKYQIWTGRLSSAAPFVEKLHALLAEHLDSDSCPQRLKSILRFSDATPETGPVSGDRFISSGRSGGPTRSLSAFHCWRRARALSAGPLRVRTCAHLLPVSL